MNDNVTEMQAATGSSGEMDEQPDKASQEIEKLRSEFQSRLMAANLRTEAAQAGMVDLDGLKMIDLSAVRLGNDDKIIGARKLMDDLRRTKPWLFTVISSSSLASAPASQPVRRKSVMEMTDEEYAEARTAITKYQF